MKILSVTPSTSVNLIRNNINLKKTNQNEYQIKNNNLNISYPNNYYINPISFAGKKASDIVKNIGEENFPSPKILEKVKELGNSRDYSLYNIHLDYYKDLLECKTLNEAKELYPEFRDVINVCNLDINSLDKKSSLYKILNGDMGKIDTDNLSLEFLKRYYGKLYSVNKKEEYWGLSYSGIKNLAKKLNIKLMNKNYACTISKQSDNFKKNLSETIRTKWKEDINYRNAISEKNTKRSKDKKYQTAMSETIKKCWEDKDSVFNSKKYRKTKSKVMIKRWENQEYRDKMAIIDKAHSLAYKRHPEITNKMSEIAKKYPLLTSVLGKITKGIKLNEKDIKYRAAYFRECEESIPEYKKIIAEEQHKILIEWGIKDE